MTQEEFEKLISEDPALVAPMRKAAAAISHKRMTFAATTELAAIAVVFPIVIFVVKEIGLPWLYEAKRYSELWRLQFHKWIDEQYRGHGLDPDATEAAGNALRRELEAITETKARKSWERFATLLREDKRDSAEEKV